VTVPVFSREHKLVLPEGTKLSGEVVLVNKARAFHRAGQLRFDLRKVDLPQQAMNLEPNALAATPATMKTRPILEAAEASASPFKVDSEGGVKVEEPKNRFIAPALALAVASLASYEGRHADPDAPGGYKGGGPNLAGRTLGGGLGLGLLGAAIAQTSPYVGMALRYYGLGWAVYSSISWTRSGSGI